MHGTTTGKDIFLEVQKILQTYNLQWNQLQCVTVDGGKNMIGLKKGMVGRIMSKLEELQLPKALFLRHPGRIATVKTATVIMATS